jgi:rhodanese-related sulfurtransferase
VPDSKIKRIDARALKAQLHDGGELALLDAREEWPFGKRHLLMASCIPLSRLELMVDDLVPRRGTRVVWCDDGEGLSARAAERMSALGYDDVAWLDGGIAVWEAAGCESAWGPDADRHAKRLIHLAVEGLTLNACSHSGSEHPTATSKRWRVPEQQQYRQPVDAPSGPLPCASKLPFGRPAVFLQLRENRPRRQAPRNPVKFLGAGAGY